MSLVQRLAVTEADTDGPELQAAPGSDGSGYLERYPSVSSDTLTLREWEVLGWVSRGFTNREIARVLALSEHTVKNHVRNILHKLGAKNRTAASIHFRERSYRPLAHLPDLLGVARG